MHFCSILHDWCSHISAFIHFCYPYLSIPQYSRMQSPLLKLPLIVRSLASILLSPALFSHIALRKHNTQWRSHNNNEWRSHNNNHVMFASCRTPRNTVIVIGCVWVTNLLVLTPVAVHSTTMGVWMNGGKQLFCVVVFSGDDGRQTYTLCLFLCYYVAPLLVIVVCYSLMTISLWRSVSPHFLRQNFARAMQFRRRVARTVMAIVIVFAACWLPIHCVHLQDDFSSDPLNSKVPYAAKIIAHCMTYASAVFNPVIYAFTSQSFRQSFRNVFSVRKRNSLASPGRRRTVVGVCNKRQREQRHKALSDIAEEIPLTEIAPPLWRVRRASL